MALQEGAASCAPAAPAFLGRDEIFPEKIFVNSLIHL
jgi:hypothetical protein